MEEIKVVVESKKNGAGTAGFVLGLTGLILCWVPVLDIILLLLGFIFSFIGLFRNPRGLAIAGFLLSIIGAIIVFLAIIGIVAMSSK